jgi:hypothetical protein
VTEQEWWWEPLALEEAAALMDEFPGPWWVAAGWAIELHVGSATRPGYAEGSAAFANSVPARATKGAGHRGIVRGHGDVDILVLRDDQEAIRRQLPGWDVQIAHGGRLEPWAEGARIELPRSGLWARSDPDGPWQLQFLLAERDGETWWFRRDPRIRVPLGEIGLRSSGGVPYLRPEVTLLFKSKDPRERDETDFAAVLPLLDAAARSRLAEWLPPDHPWRNRILGRDVYKL